MIPELVSGMGVAASAIASLVILLPMLERWAAASGEPRTRAVGADVRAATD
jgi:hypothetical protein